MKQRDAMPLELIRTYTGSYRRVTAAYAYRCTRCERIFTDLKDREKAVYHECKGRK